jgi:hypothetical protein
LIVCRPREQRAEEEALSSKKSKNALKDVKERKRDDRGRQAGRQDLPTFKFIYPNLGYRFLLCFLLRYLG